MVRISGPQAGPLLRALGGKIPSARVATRVLLRDVGQRPIDDAVMLWFPGPASATGEDVAEFHVHGGRAVLAALFAALAGFENVRAAEPGEFTHWRGRIIEASALIEAGIDFSDEGDVPAELIAPAMAKIKTLLAEIENVLAAQGQSERLRDGLVVAIAGPPNVGKSTLMNQLARREVAIVSPHAGTTRDVIEVQLDLDGYPVTVIDTAGIRETDDPVEQEGVRRARARADDADLVLWLSDSADPEVGHHGAAPLWLVRNKIDLEAGTRPMAQVGAGVVFQISASRGDGVPELISALVSFAKDYFGGSEGGLIGRTRQRKLLEETTRQRKLLEETVASLQRSIDVVGQGEELAAEELRTAVHSLGRLLGRVDVEDILDKIFREFCVGK